MPSAMKTASGTRNAASSTSTSRGSFSRVSLNAIVICFARSPRLGLVLAALPLAGDLADDLADVLADVLADALAAGLLRRNEGMSSKDRRAGQPLAALFAALR